LHSEDFISVEDCDREISICLQRGEHQTEPSVAFSQTRHQPPKISLSEVMIEDQFQVKKWKLDCRSDQVGSEGGRQRESGRWEVESGKQSNLYKLTEEGKGRNGYEQKWVV